MKMKIANQNFIIPSRKEKSVSQVQKIEQSDNVVILQSTETEIKISHPAGEYLAKGSILETHHPIDKVQAMDSTL